MNKYNNFGGTCEKQNKIFIYCKCIPQLCSNIVKSHQCESIFDKKKIAF